MYSNFIVSFSFDIYWPKLKHLLVLFSIYSYFEIAFSFIFPFLLIIILLLIMLF